MSFSLLQLYRWRERRRRTSTIPPFEPEPRFGKSFVMDVSRTIHDFWIRAWADALLVPYPDRAIRKNSPEHFQFKETTPKRKAEDELITNVRAAMSVNRLLDHDSDGPQAHGIEWSTYWETFPCKGSGWVRQELVTKRGSHFRLLDLPAEILQVIGEHLPPAATVAARLTCRTLHRCVKPSHRPYDLDFCAWSIVRQLLDERDDHGNGMQRCALCKTLYPFYLYRRSRMLDPGLAPSPVLFTGDLPKALRTTDQHSWVESHEAPARTRICGHHVLPRFVFPVTSSQYFEQGCGQKGHDWAPATLDAPWSTEPLWACFDQQVCMHCARIVICACSVQDCGKCSCECDSCGIQEVRCWFDLSRMGAYKGPRKTPDLRAYLQNWLMDHATEWSFEEPGFRTTVSADQDRITACANADWDALHVRRQGVTLK